MHSNFMQLCFSSWQMNEIIERICQLHSLSLIDCRNAMMERSVLYSVFFLEMKESAFLRVNSSATGIPHSTGLLFPTNVVTKIEFHKIGGNWKICFVQLL